MANWGAFAGGVAKGYLAGEELIETRKRTKAIQDEAEIRKQQAEQRATEFKWKEDERKREQSYRDDVQSFYELLKPQYTTDADGNIDPMNPDNAHLNTKLYGYELAAQRKHLGPSLQNEKAAMEFTEGMKNKRTADAFNSFYQTGDVKHLEKVDPDFKGAKVVIEQGPGGSHEVLVMPDGSKRSMEALYSMTPAGKNILEARNKETDNQRAERQLQEQKRHNQAVESRLGAQAGEKPTKEDKELDKVFATYKPTLPEQFKDAMGKRQPDDRGELIAREIARGIMQNEKGVSANQAVSRATKVMDEVNKKTSDLMAARKLKGADEFQRLRMEVMDEAMRGGPVGPPGSLAPPAEPNTVATRTKRGAALMDKSVLPPGTVQTNLTGR